MQEAIPCPGDDHAAHPCPPGFGRFGRALFRLSQALALAGGLVFVALVAMSIVSIVGRKIGLGPVPGDVELLQMSAAFAAAYFFAYCHLQGHDVRVDFFTARWPRAVRAGLDVASSLLLTVFGGLVAWRTAVGALSLQASGETSMILGLPAWMPLALIVPGFVLLGLAGACTAWHAATGASSGAAR